MIKLFKKLKDKISNFRLSFYQIIELGLYASFLGIGLFLVVLGMLIEKFLGR